jgi:hypothetical protein
MALHTPLWMQTNDVAVDITPTAQEFRRLLSGLMQGFGGGQGVFSQSDFLVTQRGAGANFSVDIPAGFATVIGDDVTAQGIYYAWNDAVINLATPTAPGSGTRLHRLVLQIRDKLHNGAYTTYDCVPLIVQDTGSGFPAEPNSAITLAQISIAAGQVSVQNANITDYAQMATGTVSAVKTGDQTRSSATLVNDGDIQLLRLAANAVYQLSGHLTYDTTLANSLVTGFSVASGVTMSYHSARWRGSNVHIGVATGTDASEDQTSTVTSDGGGAGVPQGVSFFGWVATTNAPAWVVLQWGSGTGGTNVVLHKNSNLRLARVA